MKRPNLVLASKSRARSRLLAAAGLEFISRPAGIDEAAIRQSLDASADMPPEDVALILAEAKATFVAAQHTGDVVIGADQILEFQGRIITKAASIEEARKTLMALRGRTHRLVSAVAIVRDGATIWRHTEHAELVMREFSNGFLGKYLSSMGSRLTETVGAYEIEGPGLQLFCHLSGDIFTIQGLPLLPLLEFLRSQDLIDQ